MTEVSVGKFRGSYQMTGGSVGNFGGSAYLTFLENSSERKFHTSAPMSRRIASSIQKCKNWTLKSR